MAEKPHDDVAAEVRQRGLLLIVLHRSSLACSWWLGCSYSHPLSQGEPETRDAWGAVSADVPATLPLIMVRDTGWRHHHSTV